MNNAKYKILKCARAAKQYGQRTGSLSAASSMSIHIKTEPRHEKTCLRGLRPRKT